MPLYTFQNLLEITKLNKYFWYNDFLVISYFLSIIEIVVVTKIV